MWCGPRVGLKFYLQFFVPTLDWQIFWFSCGTNPPWVGVWVRFGLILDFLTRVKPGVGGTSQWHCFFKSSDFVRVILQKSYFPIWIQCGVILEWFWFLLLGPSQRLAALARNTRMTFSDSFLDLETRSPWIYLFKSKNAFGGSPRVGFGGSVDCQKEWFR